MARSVPPLNSLHVFEVVARLGNFTRAADELNVSQSAVSRHIAQLEDYLRTDLFNRERVGVTLTSAGKAYCRRIGPAFAAIAEATIDLRKYRPTQTLSLHVYPTFAAKWLIPRLVRFESRHPEVQIRLKTGVMPIEFPHDDIDLAIQLIGDDQAPRAGMRLFSDTLQPVCSPSLSIKSWPKTIDDVVSLKLLHSRYRRQDWKDWLTAKGRPDLHSAVEKGLEFPSSMLSYQAAIAGLGVAIGQTRLLGEDIREGRLVTLLPPAVERPLSYHAVWCGRREPDINIRKFVSWLADEIEPGQERRSVAANAALMPG